ANGFRCIKWAHFDGLDAHIFKQAPRLVVNKLGCSRLDFLGGGRILDGHRSQCCQGMTAQAGAGNRIGRQATRTRWSKRPENKKQGCALSLDSEGRQVSTQSLGVTSKTLPLGLVTLAPF